MSVKLLIISGGGVYGAIPCTFLSRLAPSDIRIVDVFGGTSVGGILSLHLALHGDPPKMCSDFNANVRSFFTRRLSNRISPFTPKYCDEGIESALKDVLPGKVSECSGKFVVPSFSFKNMSPVIFHNLDDSFSEMEVWKIGRATSAAPMYFPPFSENILLDGGILENIPIITTASMACKHLGVMPSDMDVFAIGTGSPDLDCKRTIDEVSRYSKLDWAKNLMPTLVTGGNEMMSQLWGDNMGFRSFTYYNPIIIDGVMDNVGQVPKVEEMCEIHIGDFLRKWREFAE